jgi:hypothetical protein
MSDRTWWNLRWFPERRMDPDFPLALWLAGLWFYLKSFLYFCYVYMTGVEPPPYPPSVIAETAYFGLTIVPCLLLGLAMWNEKKRYVFPAMLFLGLDTPVLALHVLRLADGGFLDSGLTKAMELGSLTINLIAFVWLVAYFTASKTTSLSSRNTAR